MLNTVQVFDRELDGILATFGYLASNRLGEKRIYDMWTGFY